MTVKEATTAETKVCRKCGEAKPCPEFRKRSKGQGRLQSYCKECERVEVRAAVKRWYERNPDKAAASRRRYAEANRERLREYHRQYRATHPRGTQRAERAPTPPCFYCGGRLWRLGKKRGVQSYICRDCRRRQSDTTATASERRQRAAEEATRKAARGAAKGAATLAEFFTAVDPEAARLVEILPEYWRSWLSVREAARRLGVSRQCVYLMIGDGRLRTLNTGRKTWVWHPHGAP
jgi:excisionase family DNA binding protein